MQYLQQRNTVQEVEGRLRETRLDGLRQQAILGQDVQSLKSEIASLEAKLTEIRVTLRYQELRSPVDGVVFDLKPKGPGYTAPNTETVMKIVPFNALEAGVEVPSNDMAVRVGMNADVSIIHSYHGFWGAEWTAPITPTRYPRPAKGKRIWVPSQNSIGQPTTRTEERSTTPLQPE